MRAFGCVLGLAFLSAAQAQAAVQWSRFFDMTVRTPLAGGIPASVVADLPGAPDIARTAEQNPFFGLKLGSADESKGGPVSRLQAVLHAWNPKLSLGASGHFGGELAQALTLYKAVYGTGQDGSSMDEKTARNLLAMADRTFWKDPPAKPVGGEVLYRASRYLGLPYDLGGDGRKSMDCALLTRLALVQAGVAPEGISRAADSQFRDAESGANGLRLRGPKEEPRPGDIVFFKNTSWQAGEAYKGVTHAGIYVGSGLLLAASSSRGGVVLHPLDDLTPDHLAGFAAPSR